MARGDKFCIDLPIHQLLMNFTPGLPIQWKTRGLTLPERFFPQFAQRMNGPEPGTPFEHQECGQMSTSSCPDASLLTSAREFCRRSSTTVSVTLNSIDRLWLRLCGLLKRGRITLPRGVPRFLSMLFTTTFLVSIACAQERVTNHNEFGVWFQGQFGNGHAFGSTTDSRMYQVEARYSRLVSTNRLIALRYVAEAVPLSVVGDPQARMDSALMLTVLGEVPSAHKPTSSIPTGSSRFSQAVGAFSISIGQCSAPLSSISPPNSGQACKCSPPGITASTLVTSTITFPTLT